MTRVRGKLCRSKKGRFTRCRGKAASRGSSRRKGRRCKYGKVKSGPRKGLCRKIRRRRR